MADINLSLAKLTDLDAGGPPQDDERPLTLVALAGVDLQIAPQTRRILGPALDQISRAARAAKFTGCAGKSMEILAPQGLGCHRLILLGVSPAKPDDPPQTQRDIGGCIYAKVGDGANAVILFDPPEVPIDSGCVGDFMLGLRLRAFKFDAYKSKKTEDDSGVATQIRLVVEDPTTAAMALESTRDLTDAVLWARELVNEPANVLTPTEFASRAAKLESLGVEVEILDRSALEALKMAALLGVAQGSIQEPRVVVMRWHGAEKDAAPLALVGKGVCFDSGGISIKPAAGMEDMKGDMAGAAAVVGAMWAIASRKAKANVVGVIGLVENMPDGAAQRPGDIVRSASGQTIEVINTDAEGRLVLADLLHYVREKFEPKAIIDLATLTGAILVALGQDYAGLFSNNDDLSQKIEQAGRDCDEKVWRMPMGPTYDKMIDSTFADMKNTAGRYGGSITAAQFLKRFVGATPWAHLDIAGVAISSPKTAINQGWASGWGVRLLNRLVRDNFE